MDSRYVIDDLNDLIAHLQAVKSELENFKKMLEQEQCPDKESKDPVVVIL